MNPALLVILANVVDIVLGAILKKPELAPKLGPLVTKLLPALSQAAGETPEQTAARREEAESVFARWAEPPHA